MEHSNLKLDPDSIEEALVEYRFDGGECALLPEAVVGRLVSNPKWVGFRVERLPTADLPHNLRIADANLRYQPTMQLFSPDRKEVVKVGPQVLSYHALRPYPGWEVLGEYIFGITDFVLKSIRDASLSRIGLRYVNGFKEKVHPVESVSDLSYDVTIGGERLKCSQNLNYKRSEADGSVILVRIASKDFISGPVPNINVIVDIDVSTDGLVPITDGDWVNRWISNAHDAEKREYFRLLPTDLVQKLKG